MQAAGSLAHSAGRPQPDPRPGSGDTSCHAGHEGPERHAPRPVRRGHRARSPGSRAGGDDRDDGRTEPADHRPARRGEPGAGVAGAARARRAGRRRAARRAAAVALPTRFRPRDHPPRRHRRVRRRLGRRCGDLAWRRRSTDRQPGRSARGRRSEPMLGSWWKALRSKLVLTSDTTTSATSTSPGSRRWSTAPGQNGSSPRRCSPGGGDHGHGGLRRRRGVVHGNRHGPGSIASMAAARVRRCSASARWRSLSRTG